MYVFPSTSFVCTTQWGTLKFVVVRWQNMNTGQWVWIFLQALYKKNPELLLSRTFLTLQWCVHAAHLIKARVPLTADDLWHIWTAISYMTRALLELAPSLGNKNKSLSTFTRVWPRGPPSFLRSTNMVSISFPSQATSLFLSPSSCDRVEENRNKWHSMILVWLNKYSPPHLFYQFSQALQQHWSHCFLQ